MFPDLLGAMRVRLIPSFLSAIKVNDDFAAGFSECDPLVSRVDRRKAEVKIVELGPDLSGDNKARSLAQQIPMVSAALAR
jgi:hypothetical protein